MNQSEPQRWFITGVAGFIGSHAARRLLDAGHFVRGYDNLSSGSRDHLRSFAGESRFEFVEADLLDLQSLKTAMTDSEVILHLGANTDIPGGERETRLDLENGVIATWNVLESIRLLKIKSLLFPSSSTVLGEPDIRPTSESFGPLLPISLYGAGKLAAEGFISAYCELTDLRARIFRLGNVIGGRMNHGAIYDFVKKLTANPHELEILGDGKQEKNYFLVEDCIDGILRGFEHGGDEPCTIFHLGADTTVTIREIARIVIEEMGLTSVRIHVQGNERGWVGDVPIVKYDISKIKRIGWQPKRSSAEAVRIATRQLLDKEF